MRQSKKPMKEKAENRPFGYAMREGEEEGKTKEWRMDVRDG
jgi:hypothetical protein